MKTIILALLLVTNFCYGQEQETKYHNPTADLENGEQYYLYGNDVQFQKLPDAHSELIQRLKIGTAIQIIEKSNKTAHHNGMEMPFYKVKYQDKIGYILGGFISLEKVTANGSTYLFAYQKRNENQYSVLIRNVKDNASFTETSAELNTATFSIEISDNKGIKGIQNILFIDYLAEACGIEGGGIYFFQLKNELKKVFEITQISDAGAYWVAENLIFPTDENGVEGKIVYQKEAGDYIDGETNWVEIKKVSRELEWKNGAILPKIEAEE